MKLSTTCIAALATSTFLVAVSAESACDSIADVTEGFGVAVEALGLIFEKVAPLQVFFSVFGVVANAACAAEKILTIKDVEGIVECAIRESDYKRLANGVDSLTNLISAYNITISANKKAEPSEFNNYASEAQALEADGKSTGCQASLLNVDLAVIKLAMFKSKYLSLEDGDEVNNAKGQAVAGIEKSLEYMSDLENDLTDFIDRSNRQVEKEKTCIDYVLVDCGFKDRPSCQKRVCDQWRWDLNITYCSEKYTYSKTSFQDELSQEYINARIQDTKDKLKNKFFPNAYYDVKNKLKAERDSLYDSLKEVDFKFESDLVINEEEKKNKSFDAEL